MKKEDINYELISKIEIKVDDTLFYMPGEVIKGKIILNPQYKTKDTVFHLTLKVVQYEFWEYNNTQIDELKNIYKTDIQVEKIEYKLNELELGKNKSSDSYEDFSIIKKEKEDKIIIIPFVFKLNNDKILPTFQYINKDYILGIRHLLIADCKEYNSSNYTGLFIGKNKNIELSKEKYISEKYWVGLGSLEIGAGYPKLSFNTDEPININIYTHANLHFKKVTEITQTLYRKINWIGYLKNSNLDRTIYNTEKLQYNENEYGTLQRITSPLGIIKSSVVGVGEAAYSGGEALNGLIEALPFCACPLLIFIQILGSIEDEDYKLIDLGPPSFVQNIIGGIIGAPFGLIGGFIKGICDQGKVVKDCLNLNDNKNYMSNNFKGKIKLSEEEKNLLIEEVKKFVYFKDNKVVGFIKFGENITPPVNGYYFNCEYNIKIEVNIAGIILNRNKYLKTQIDIYDSDEYIAKMKNIFKN